MEIHCIYCAATLEVKRIRHDKESEEIKARRLEFETYHDEHCGPKSIGMILDLPEKE